MRSSYVRQHVPKLSLLAPSAFAVRKYRRSLYVNHSPYAVATNTTETYYRGSLSSYVLPWSPLRPFRLSLESLLLLSQRMANSFVLPSQRMAIRLCPPFSSRSRSQSTNFLYLFSFPKFSNSNPSILQLPITVHYVIFRHLTSSFIRCHILYHKLCPPKTTLPLRLRNHCSPKPTIYDTFQIPDRPKFWTIILFESSRRHG